MSIHVFQRYIIDNNDEGIINYLNNETNGPNLFLCFQESLLHKNIIAINIIMKNRIFDYVLIDYNRFLRVLQDNISFNGEIIKYLLTNKKIQDEIFFNKNIQGHIYKDNIEIFNICLKFLNKMNRGKKILKIKNKIS